MLTLLCHIDIQFRSSHFWDYDSCLRPKCSYSSIAASFISGIYMVQLTGETRHAETAADRLLAVAFLTGLCSNRLSPFSLPDFPDVSALSCLLLVRDDGQAQPQLLKPHRTKESTNSNAVLCRKNSVAFGYTSRSTSSVAIGRHYNLACATLRRLCSCLSC